MLQCCGRRLWALSLIACAAFLGCNSGEPTRPTPIDEPVPSSPSQPVDTPAAPPVFPSSARAFFWSSAKGLHEIPVPAGAVSLRPTAISDAGEVTGMIVVQGQQRAEAFVWSESRGLRRTGLLSDVDGGAVVTGINASGTIVGYVPSYSGPDLRAFAWNDASGLTPPSGDRFAAHGINDAGSIVGNEIGGPVRWTSRSGYQPLPLGSAECTVATAVNDNGEVLGWLGDDVNGFGCHPQSWVVWRGDANPVEVLRCRVTTFCNLELLTINDAGQVVGRLDGYAIRLNTRTGGQMETVAAFAYDLNDSGDAAVEYQSSPYVWARDGTFRPIPLLPETTRGTATAINNRGEVAGTMR